MSTWTDRQDLQSIASIVSEKHQTEVLEEQLKDFAGKLQTLLLLDHPYCWAKLEGSVRKKRHRILRNLLFIKIHAFNPDTLLGNLEQKLRFCFSPAFAAVSLDHRCRCPDIVHPELGIAFCIAWNDLFAVLDSADCDHCLCNHDNP